MADALAALPQLVVEGYRATTFDYDPPADADPSTRVGKEKWIAVFRASIPEFSRRAASDPRVADASALARRFAASFDADLDRVASGDHASLFEGAPTVLKLCGLRDRALRDLGFEDCFLDVKTAENAKALAASIGVEEIDAIRDPGARIEALVRGVFAGNVFDLGAAASAARHADGDGGFEATRAGLRRRPWCVDHLDAFRDAWLECATTDEATRDVVSDVVSFPSPWKKCVLFVDNAGADVVLGMLPLCRELLRGGAEVVLAANERPEHKRRHRARVARAASARRRGGARASRFQRKRKRFQRKRVSTRVGHKHTRGGLERVRSAGDRSEPRLRGTRRRRARRGFGRAGGHGARNRNQLVRALRVRRAQPGDGQAPEVAQCLRGTLYDCVCRFARPEE